MSIWEFIGWLIAVPMALMTLIFVIAVCVAVVRVTVKRTQKTQQPKPVKKTPGKRHLRIVE